MNIPVKFPKVETAWRWLKLKRVCAWHPGGPHYMGGNPLAKNITHGLCPSCLERVKGELRARA